MPVREKFKDIVIAERKFRIGKLDALTGSWILYKVLTQVLPMGLEAQMGIALPDGRSTMSRDDFIEIQRACLMVCREIQTINDASIPVNVMLETGEWGVDGLQDDTMTVIALTVHALLFNVTGFFEEGALKALMDSFAGLSLFNAPTSTGTPSPQ